MFEEELPPTDAPVDDTASAEAAELGAELDDVLKSFGGDAANDTASAPDELSTADVLMGLISPAFDLLAPRWEVSAPEKQALAEAYGGLLDKYFPDGGMNRFGAEITAVGITVAVLRGRIGTPRKLPEKKAANDDSAEGEQIAS